MGELDFFVVCSWIYLCFFFNAFFKIVFAARLRFRLSLVHSLSSEYCVCFINLISRCFLGFTRTLKVPIGG